jgi:acetoin utilization protein AcuB
MLVSDVIQRTLEPVSPETLLVDIFPERLPENLHFLPVVEGESFIGFLPLTDLEIDLDLHEKVKECDLETTNQSVSPNQHIFEVLVVFQKAALPVLPVLSEASRYEGIIQLDNVLTAIAESYAFQTEGGILVLSVKAIDYSLSEISRLVEANQGKVLAAIVEADPFTHEKMLVHLKINLPDLSRVISTFERYEYHILEVHHKSEVISLDQDRLAQLLKYLGI